MTFLRLSRESLGEVKLKGGTASHKFISTPTRIYFGNDGEYHRELLCEWRDISNEDPDLLEAERRMFAEQSLRPCGSYMETQDLAVIDAGLMVVEGIKVPKTVAFTSRSEEYGLGDRARTRMIAEAALRGTWKMHLPE